MKVIPNSAMITVTTADSKYSRQTDFGGPLGLVSTGGWPWPLRWKIFEKENGAASVFVSTLLSLLRPLEGLLLICKIILDTLSAMVKCDCLVSKDQPQGSRFFEMTLAHP